MKFLKLSLGVLFAFLTTLSITFFRSAPCFVGGENYTFFTGKSSQSCKIVKATTSPALCKLFLSDVCGELATYKNLDLGEFLKSTGANIVFTERLFDSTNYYCTADMPYAITLYGQQINLHICVKDDAVLVGSPIIFGGY